MQNKNEIKLYSEDEFMIKYNPITINKELRSIKSCKELINCDNGVAFYKKHYGEDLTVSVVEMHLSVLNESLNVHGKLTPFQIKDIATELIYTFFYLTIKEFAYVFNKVKRGEYGIINYSIDMPKVFEWFKLYDIERSNQSAQNRQNEHKQHKTGKTIIDGKIFETGSQLHELQIKALKEFTDKVPKKFDEEDYKQFKKSL